MSTDIAAAVATLLQIQLSHHHEPGIGICVKIPTCSNSSCMSGFGGGGHTFSVPWVTVL
jgi:hypothetical protein